MKIMSLFKRAKPRATHHQGPFPLIRLSAGMATRKGISAGLLEFNRFYRRVGLESIRTQFYNRVHEEISLDEIKSSLTLGEESYE